MTLPIDETSPEEVPALSEKFESATLEQILQWAWDRFGAQAAIGTSFQGSGLVILHQAIRAGLRFPVFTIDTGFLFPETLELKRRLEDFLGIEIESLYPEQSPQEQASEHGEKLWERSPDLCCTIRKVLPLQKKLEHLAVWITGLRRQQSEDREKIRIVELYKFDALRDHYILKLNPMAAWTRDAVWSYLRAHKIPHNSLHDQGFLSIGCTHCTQATGGAANERAGRWTGFEKSECGIHTFLGTSL